MKNFEWTYGKELEGKAVVVKARNLRMLTGQHVRFKTRDSILITSGVIEDVTVREVCISGDWYGFRQITKLVVDE